VVGTNKSRLGADVIAGIVEAKRLFQTGRLRRYEGRELLSATAGKRGAYLVEHQVGSAHAGDMSPAGRRRLVMLVQASRIEEMYFSNDHYQPGSWRRIVDF
jgi:hypothetical protein